jgi:hypothetical protein
MRRTELDSKAVPCAVFFVCAAFFACGGTSGASLGGVDDSMPSSGSGSGGEPNQATGGSTGVSSVETGGMVSASGAGGNGGASQAPATADAGSTGGGGGGAGSVVVPPSAWANATGNLSNMASECGNVSLVAARPHSNMIIAGVAQKGLWATEDGGTTWSKLGTGPSSAVITNRMSSIVFDPEHSDVFWESGTWNGGGVYKTTDGGKTFAQVGNIAHNDSVSVDLADPDRKTMLAGPHEAAQKLYLSTNGGGAWSDIGASLPGGTGFCNSNLILSATTFLVGCEGSGIFLSTNTGGSWMQVGSKPVLPQPLRAASGSIYWSGNGGGVLKSSNQGQQFAQSTTATTAVGVGAPTSLAELPDGRIVVIGKDHLQASADGGQTWKAIGDPLPSAGGGWAGWSGVTYSSQTKTFFIWRWDCGDKVLPDAIRSAGFDYTTN